MLRSQGNEERRILPFAAPPERTRRRPDRAGETRGAILFFTGVRYQRMIDGAADRSGSGDRQAGS